MKKFYFPFLVLMIVCLKPQAQPEWKVVKPTNTGITGDVVHFGKFDPQGNLWVSARWPFWSEGGIAKYDGVKWTPYSNVDTWMPSQYVNSVAFQADGVAWIGTGEGLIRFDGTNTQVFNMSNAPFPSNNISDVHIDGLGNIWFLSMEGSTTAHGVIKYDGTTWTVYNTSNSGIPHNYITSIGVDLNNHVWVGTWGSGIATYNGTVWTVYNGSTSGYNGGMVTGFAFPQNGEVWVTASQSGIYKFSNNVWENVPALPGNYDYSTVAIHPDGTFWFGTYSGELVRYDGSGFTPYEYGNHLYSIDFDSLGNVWAGGLAGIRKYENGVNTLLYNVYNTSLTSYFVDDMDFAPNGTAWFATGMGGACSYDGIKWRGFNPENGGAEPWTFPHNSANDVFVDKQDGTVWVASNGVGYWNGSGWNIFNLSNSNIPDNYVTTVNKDNQGRIWIGTRGVGTAYYNGSTWTRLRFGPNYNPNNIHAIETAPDGAVWIGTDFGLHKTTDGVNYTTYYEAVNGLPGSTINGIAFQPDGIMWVATDKGLAKFNGTTWTTYNTSNSGIPANYVSDVIVTTDGIWASAYNTMVAPYYGGIAKLSGSTWTTFMYGSSPLTHYQVHKLKLDNLGNLWISAMTEGLMMYKPGGITVPVNLLSFSGKRMNEKVLLEWKTSSEQNSSRFIIERSSSNTAGFIEIGSTPASSNSQFIKNYSFIDNAPLKGTGYYRLKMTDLDGRSTNSRIVKITGIKSDAFSVYPNPPVSYMNIRYAGNKETVSVKIYDGAGRLVKNEMRKSGPEIQVDLTPLHSGLYIIKLSDGENSFHERFIKSN